MSDDPVLDAAARLLDEKDLVGTVDAGVLVYEWIHEDGQGAIGFASSEGIRDATMLGLLEWARSHVVADMLDQPELE